MLCRAYWTVPSRWVSFTKFSGTSPRHIAALGVHSPHLRRRASRPPRAAAWRPTHAAQSAPRLLTPPQRGEHTPLHTLHSLSLLHTLHCLSSLHTLHSLSFVHSFLHLWKEGKVSDSVYAMLILTNNTIIYFLNVQIRFSLKENNFLLRKI